MLSLSDFDYELPKELIAQYPEQNRDQARLLVLGRSNGEMRHAVFSGLGSFLRPGDLLVLNDTKVLPARLKGARATGGKVEVMLLRRKTGSTFQALLKPARLRMGETVQFDSGTLRATVSGKNEVTFDCGDIAQIYGHGTVPLPPYIKREPETLDTDYYQTVYARSEGSVAAPTAGLHFTRPLLENLRSSGVNIAYLTLHVGYATFKPVKCNDITGHRMEGESFVIPEGLPELIGSTRSSGGRVIAVGTTSMRCLESFARTGKKMGETDLFIYPGYDFRICDGLLTNFHLPKTTLLMLACAFGGTDNVKAAYRKAVELKYRFYSYGDAMLIV